ncbi:MAG: DNA double-strand break repair nuclease NurA [Candidatus Babeliaceae bacterium]|nr:DNA double-strand break repair nuclease NurA [Candidatus Babeliaceae bacterium]
MLDTLRLVKLIQQQSRIQKTRYQEQKDTARLLWEKIIKNTDLQQQLLQKNNFTFNLPLGTIYNANMFVNEYTVCGIDGSQIYPDRHEGFSEYLINIGTAHFIYSSLSRAELDTTPYVFSGFEDGAVVTAELVNAQRTNYELAHAVAVARHESNPIIMFDGALMFWHLQTPIMQELFLQNYLEYLRTLHKENKKYLGYISASHSCELVTLLEKAAQLMGISATFDHLVDTDIIEFFLKKNQYTQVFKPTSDLSIMYPAQLRPCFIYLHVGSEIARIELPEYLTGDQDTIAHLVGLISDQVEKGNGYPVALSEAHEQAVVKAKDRDFFYAMLQMHHQKKITTSLKLSKKRSAAL